MKNKKLVWIILFEDFEVDGRVQRQVQALSDTYDVSVYSVTSKDIRSNYLNAQFIKIGSKVGFSHSSLIHLIKNLIFAKKNPDAILFNNIYTIPALILLKLFFRKSKFIYDSHELIVPDPITKYSIASKKSIFLERIGVKFSDLILCTNEKRSELMQQYYGLSKAPTSIENFVDIIPCSEDDKKVYKVRGKDKVKFLYQGILKDGRYLKELVDAFVFCELSEFHIYGFGPIESDLKDLALNHGILNSKVYFHGKLARDNLYSETIKYDAGLVLYDFSNMNNTYCSPNKTSEYILSGLPILCTPQESLSDLIEKHGVGECFSRVDLDNNSKLVASTIDKFAKNISCYQLRVNEAKDEFNFKKQADILRVSLLYLLSEGKV
ncbi:hypothetical protein ACWE7R_002963 [Escherichia coli]|uniref:Glucosyltransferase 3-like C-terminal domain-containing protein n=1 Tax=Escherichia coli HVH 36 (4-5675286) TaxID=1280986 RepID=A0A7U9IT78_ECOLX|nr:hypothetical protein [Escherichia coli]EFG7794281.1 glycosyltransferase family 4 protein [Escherichia coli]EFG8574708.1 glycosyltransferase family 4 protein [Escherichia coli]EHW2904588.1 hypothetical protein [Escherichia coli]EJU1234928.1 hypothetical protein [Escherichia coli]ELF5034564.1 hypothetical protein [Escherichia coli]